MMSACVFFKAPLADLINQSPIHEYLSGQSLCRLGQVTSTFGVLQAVVGGSAIGTMRLLFVKYPTKLHLGQMTVALVLTSFSVAITTILTYLWDVAPRASQSLESLCLGRPIELDRTLFRIASPEHTKGIFALGVISCGFSLVCIEISSYIALCIFLVKHNKMMQLVLPEIVINTRIRKNVIDAMGHIFDFLLQAWILVTAALGSYWIPPYARFILRCFLTSSYGVQGAFHIWFSPVLRSEFLDWLSYLTQLVSSVQARISSIVRLNQEN